MLQLAISFPPKSHYRNTGVTQYHKIKPPLILHRYKKYCCIWIQSNVSVAGIVQTFIKSWNQLLYPQVTEVCRQPFEPRHDFFLHFVVNISPSFGEFNGTTSSNFADS